MKCSEVSEKLSLYVDHMLNENTIELIEAHLAECANCHKELAALEMLVGTTSSIEEVDTPSGLKHSILAAVQDNEHCNCGEVSSLIPAYIDSELTTTQSSLIRAHILECEACAKELNELRTIAAAAALIDSVEPPSELRASITAATSQRIQAEHITVGEWLHQIMSQNSTRWAGSAVAAGMVALGVIVALPHPEQNIHHAAIHYQKPAPIATNIKPAQHKDTDKVALVEPAHSAVVSTASEPAVNNNRHIRKYRKHIETLAELPIEKPKPVISKKLVKTALLDKPAAQSAAKQEVAEEKDTNEVAAAPAPETSTEPTKKETTAAIKVAVARVVDQSDTKEWMEHVKSEATMRRNNTSGGITIVSSRF